MAAGEHRRSLWLRACASEATLRWPMAGGGPSAGVLGDAQSPAGCARENWRAARPNQPWAVARGSPLAYGRGRRLRRPFRRTPARREVSVTRYT
eukprot:8302232-Pyramimonas_sp.AAC.1